MASPIAVLNETQLSAERYLQAFNLTGRKTKARLLADYSPTILAAQQAYIKSVSLADEEKSNPKECPVRSKLMTNLSDHLHRIHKLDKLSKLYKDYFDKAEVIPKCYTKTNVGETVKLTGKELEDAKTTYQRKVEEQTEMLTSTKASRDFMSNLRHQMDNTEDPAEYESLELELLKAEKD